VAWGSHGGDNGKYFSPLAFFFGPEYGGGWYPSSRQHEVTFQRDLQSCTIYILQLIVLLPFIAALGPTQPPIQSVWGGALSPEVKRPGREADNSLPTSAEVKNT
jgi:hypothetical protein